MNTFKYIGLYCRIIFNTQGNAYPPISPGSHGEAIAIIVRRMYVYTCGCTSSPKSCSDQSGFEICFVYTREH